MSKAIKLSEDMVGKKVRCVKKRDSFHPDVGTIGTIVKYYKEDDDMNYQVQWPKNSIPFDDSQSLTWAGGFRTWVYNDCIELVEDDVTDNQEIPNMTNEEIWEMLQPKLKKNNLTPYWSLTGEENHYYESDVINAIAVAYRSGYERCMKGRPFKFHDRKAKKAKKQDGHWEPVDSKNLPRNGTKVRYTRYNVYWEEKTDWKIGDCGHVLIFKGEKYSFGVCPDKTDNRHAWDWCNCPECLDMWVEDDE